MRIEIVTEASSVATAPAINDANATTADPSRMTLAIHGEDHTLGNALRYMIMKNPRVELCAYTIPHPSEDKIHFCVQTDGSCTALEALHKGLDDLMLVTKHCADTLVAQLDADGTYELDDGSRGTVEC